MSDMSPIRLAVLFVLAILLPAPAFPQDRGGAGLKANLDLPFDAGSDEEEESESPEIVIFYGQQFEGDGVFFCCDSSLSMRGPKFRRLQAEVSRAISQFSERVQFGIVLFGSTVDKFPEQGKPAEAKPANKAAGAYWIWAREPGGASCYQEGLLTALQMANQATSSRRIIITLGDGQPSCPGYGNRQQYAQDTLNMVSERNVLKVKINAICIGGIRAVDEEWMRQLAARNGGTYTRIME